MKIIFECFSYFTSGFPLGLGLMFTKCLNMSFSLSLCCWNAFSINDYIIQEISYVHLTPVVNFGEVRRAQLAKCTLLTSMLVPLGSFQTF